mmetsp:Transcript_86521/g.253262  ORF Transcript_86521/g.253262 Transcript_86521/m.253262 type:complete len:241 (-) Transcript_86521:1182-1904(-)
MHWRKLPSRNMPGQCWSRLPWRSSTSTRLQRMSQKLRVKRLRSSSALRQNLPADVMHWTRFGRIVEFTSSSNRGDCRSYMSPLAISHVKAVGRLIEMTIRSMATYTIKARKWNDNQPIHLGVSILSQIMSFGCGAGSYSSVTDENGMCPNLKLLYQHHQRRQSHLSGGFPKNLLASLGVLNWTNAQPFRCMFLSRVRSNLTSSCWIHSLQASLRQLYQECQTTFQQLVPLLVSYLSFHSS